MPSVGAPSRPFGDFDDFEPRDGSSIFFVRTDDPNGEDSGTIELVANREGWRSLADYCQLMAAAESPDMASGEHSWLARHFGDDVGTPQMVREGRIALVVNGREYPDSANWVMFLRSDLHAAEFMENRRRLAGT